MENCSLEMTLYSFVPMCTWIFQVTKFWWLARYMKKPLCGMLTVLFPTSLPLCLQQQVPTKRLWQVLWLVVYWRWKEIYFLWAALNDVKICKWLCLISCHIGYFLCRQWKMFLCIWKVKAFHNFQCHVKLILTIKNSITCQNTYYRLGWSSWCAWKKANKRWLS